MADPELSQQEVAEVESVDALRKQAVSPDAGFTVDTSSGVAPLSVNFDASSTEDDDDGPRTYRWDFGDGTTGTGLAATHRYVKPGIYDASLTVTDQQGNTSLVDVYRTITVTAPTTTTVGATGNAGVGVAGVLLFASVAPTSATGTVAFTDGNSPIAGCEARPVNVAGTNFGFAACVTTFATAGPHTITAAYSGDTAVGASSGSTTLAVSANPDLTQIAWGLLIQFAHHLNLFGI